MRAMVRALVAFVLGASLALVMPRAHGAVAAGSDAEWIAIAPRALAQELEPLAAHRRSHGPSASSGATAAVVTVESIEASHPDRSRTEAIRAFVREAASRGGARFVLLVGDAATLPPERVPAFFGGTCATDAGFVRLDEDSVPDRAIGRFPTSDPEEVRRLVAWTIAYETNREPAGWRRRITFLAADGGFGPALDGAIEGAVSTLLDRELPPEFDLRVLRTDESSAFGLPRDRQKEAIVDLWNGGSLIGLFAGHGAKNGLYTAGARRTRTVFRSSDAEAIDVRGGAPFLVFFACHVGDFAQEAKDASGRAAPGCLATSLLLRPRGPIAVLAASEVSHPYADILMAHEMNDLFARSADVPLGEMLREAKARLAKGGGAFREQVDRLALLFGLDQGQRDRILEYQMSLYNLVGDPAVRLARPDAVTEVRAPAQAALGAEIEVEVRCAASDGAAVIVRLELPRSAAPIRRGYPEANLRTLATAVGEIRNGVWTGRIFLPSSPEAAAGDAGRIPKRLLLVADVRGPSTQGAAATTIRIGDTRSPAAGSTGAGSTDGASARDGAR